MASRTPARDRARTYLVDLIARTCAEGRNRLPPLATLAAGAGVAPGTMLSVVRELRDEGVLRVSHGTGTTIVDGAPPPRRVGPATVSTGVSGGRKWDMLRRRIERDIVNGVFLTGELLPTSKELMARYGVCEHTLRKALRALVGTQRIAWERTRYRVAGRSRHATGGSSVVLIAAGDAGGHFRVVSPRTMEHMYILERECVRHGLRLVVLGLDPSRGLLRDYSGAGFRAEHVGRLGTVLGVVVWTIAMAPDAVRHLADGLSAARTPVCYLDESGEDNALKGLVPQRAVVYRMANNRTAGYDVGRALLDRGHREIAYVSPVHDAAYSRQRLGGLREAFTDAGVRGGVRDIVGAESDLLAVDDATAPADFIPRQAGGGMDAVSRRTGHELFTTARHETLHHATHRLVSHATPPAACTAWVAPSDTVALACLDFLESSGRGVPGDVSVVGFDDSYTALLHRITSYNFNGAAAVRGMLAQVVDSGLRRGGRAGQTVTVDGFLVERWTTALRRG